MSMIENKKGRRTKGQLFRENPWKLAALVGGTASLVASLSYLFTRHLVNIAMDREMPAALPIMTSRISGEEKVARFMQELEVDSEKLAGQPNDTVEITARDGVDLVGHFVPCENPKRILIAMHGWRSSWHRDFGMVAERWKDLGCSVLYVEQRGQNNSGGDYIGFGLTERYDCVDWVQWVLSHFGTGLPIYLVGVSMGATTVLYASGEDLPPAVHGIIADCGFTSVLAIWKHVLVENLHLFYGLKGLIAEDLFQKKTQEPSIQYSTEEALQKTDVPVLFVHGSEDHFVPVSMTYDNYLACASPKHLLIVPGADHGMSYFYAKERYEQAVIEFWQRYDHEERRQKKDLDGFEK